MGSNPAQGIKCIYGFLTFKKVEIIEKADVLARCIMGFVQVLNRITSQYSSRPTDKSLIYAVNRQQKAKN